MPLSETRKPETLGVIRLPYPQVGLWIYIAKHSSAREPGVMGNHMKEENAY